MNPVRDLVNQTLGKVAIKPQVQTNSDSAIVGEVIDTRGFDSCTFFIVTGVLTDADATFAVLVEYSATSFGAEGAVPDTMLIAAASTGQEANASFDKDDDTACRVIGYRVATGLRYVRITVTPSANNSGAAPIAAVAVLGHGGRTPAAFNP